MVYLGMEGSLGNVYEIPYVRVAVECEKIVPAKQTLSLPLENCANLRQTF